MLSNTFFKNHLVGLRKRFAGTCTHQFFFARSPWLKKVFLSKILEKQTYKKILQNKNYRYFYRAKIFLCCGTCEGVPAVEEEPVHGAQLGVPGSDLPGGYPALPRLSQLRQRPPSPTLLLWEFFVCFPLNKTVFSPFSLFSQIKR